METFGGVHLMLAFFLGHTHFCEVEDGVGVMTKWSVLILQRELPLKYALNVYLCVCVWEYVHMCKCEGRANLIHIVESFLLVVHWAHHFWKY